MITASRTTPQKTWQVRRRRVSVLAEMALRRERVAERLVELRKVHGLTQEQAAQRIGISFRQYQRWESGESYPWPSSLDRIAGSFDMSISELVDDTSGVTRDQRIDDLERRIGELEARIPPQ